MKISQFVYTYKRDNFCREKNYTSSEPDYNCHATVSLSGTPKAMDELLYSIQLLVDEQNKEVK
jgi:hypothetical protein